ncbi:hypothetical protein HDU81_002712 [Chytriomyces hyalinus]|nr:hypothetical protein HDU81_002712 [Chytriomyces hyalinus]
MVETVHEVLRLAISDSANEVRDAGRRLFSDYSEIVGPERLERFISTLPPQLQKSLHIKPATKSFTSTVEINRAKLEFRRKQELEFQRAQELLQLKKLQQQQQQYQQSQYQDWNSESQSIRSVSPTASLSRVVSPGTTHPHVPLPTASSIPTPSGLLSIHPQLISTSRPPSGRSNRTSWILPNSHTMDDEDLLQDDTSSLLDGEAPPLFGLDDFEDSSDLYAATATESLFGAISYNIPLSTGRTASIHTSMSRELGGSGRGNGSILTDDTFESENGSNGEPGANASHTINGAEAGPGVSMERSRSSRRHTSESVEDAFNLQSNLAENQKLEAAQDEEIANLVAEIRMLEQQEGLSREWQKEQGRRGRSRSSRLSSTGSLPSGIEMPPVGGVTLDMEFAAAATVPRSANELFENDEDEVSVELDPEYLRMTAGYEDVEMLDGFVEGSASFEETDSRVHDVVSMTASSEILDTATVTATPTILAEQTDSIGMTAVEEASCADANNSAVNSSDVETYPPVMSGDSAESAIIEVRVVEKTLPDAIVDGDESGRRDTLESIQTLSDNNHELAISQAVPQVTELETGNDYQNDEAFDETKEETDRMDLEPVVILCSAATSEDGGEAEVYSTLAIQVVEVDGDEQVPMELETNSANTDAEAITSESNPTNQVQVSDTVQTNEQREIPAVQETPTESVVSMDEPDKPPTAPDAGLDSSAGDVKLKEAVSESRTKQSESEHEVAENLSAPAHSAPFGSDGRIDSGAILEEGLDLHKTQVSTKDTTDTLGADAAKNQLKAVESIKLPEPASSAPETGISLTEPPKMAPILPSPVLVPAVSSEDGNTVPLLKGIISPAISDDSTTLQNSAAELPQSQAMNLPSQESRNTKSPPPPTGMRTSFLPMMTRQKSNSRPVRPDVQQLQSVPEPPRLAKTASVGRQSTLPKPASISSPAPISSLRRSSVSTNPSQARKLPAAPSPSKKSGTAFSPPSMLRTPTVTPSPSPPGMRRQGTNGKSSTGPLSSTVTPRAQVSKTASSIAISSGKSGNRNSNDLTSMVKQTSTSTSAGGGLRRAISTSVIPTVATSSTKLAQGAALRTALTTSPSKSKSLGVPSSAASPQRSVRPSTTVAALSPVPNRLTSKPQLLIASSARNLNRVKSPTNSAESSSSRGSTSGIAGNPTVVSPTSPVLSPNESERTDVSSRNSTGSVPDRRSVVISPSGKRSVVSPTGRPSPPVYRHLRAPPSASSLEPTIPESTIQAVHPSDDGVAVASIALVRTKSVSWNAEISTVMGYSDADEGAFSVANQLGDAIIQGVEGIWSFCESYSNGVGSEAWGMDAVLSRLEDIVNAVVKDLNQSIGKKRDAVHIKHGLGILKSSLDVAGMEHVGINGSDVEVKATIPENCLEGLVRCALALSAAAEGTDDNLEIEYEVSNVIEAFESRLPFPTIISVVANILKLISSAVATQPTNEVSEQRCCFEILARVLDTTVVTGRSSRPSSFVKTTPANESVDALELAGLLKQESLQPATTLVDWDSLTVLVAELMTLF